MGPSLHIEFVNAMRIAINSIENVWEHREYRNLSGGLTIFFCYSDQIALENQEDRALESILFLDHSDEALRTTRKLELKCFKKTSTQYFKLPNGDINVSAFDRMAAIVGAFTKHMHAVKTTEAPTNSEYETFCRHMQKITKMAENGLCMITMLLKS
uniref:Uncharacterized protein n=1 Tax=Glossina austeni TaxID=7395 RepID=A0A1A9UKU6_GLOAU